MLVDNPPQHPVGDFALHEDARVDNDGANKLTFAGIGVYRASLFDDWRTIIGDTPGANEEPPRFRTPPLLIAAMQRGMVDGTHHAGRWTDVGTPQRLAELDASLR